MMYMSTRLHTRLPSDVDPTTSSIMMVCCGVTGICRKSIGNGVNIFVHCFSTPISILNLTMLPESQENDVSNDILSDRKYSQLFTHESNTFMLKQIYGRRAARTLFKLLGVMVPSGELQWRLLAFLQYYNELISYKLLDHNWNITEPCIVFFKFTMCIIL